MRYALLLSICALIGLGIAGCDSSESATTSGDSGSTTAKAPSSAGNAPAPQAAETLTDALARAKERNTNVLVFYGSETCPYSRQMDQQTMSDSAVHAALGDFVVLRLEKGKNSAEFEQKWGQQPTPTVVTLNADGQPVGTMLNGVVKKSDFLTYAAWARTGQGTQPGTATGGG